MTECVCVLQVGQNPALRPASAASVPQCGHVRHDGPARRLWRPDRRGPLHDAHYRDLRGSGRNESCWPRLLLRGQPGHGQDARRRGNLLVLQKRSSAPAPVADAAALPTAALPTTIATCEPIGAPSRRSHSGHRRRWRVLQPRRLWQPCYLLRQFGCASGSDVRRIALLLYWEPRGAIGLE